MLNETFSVIFKHRALCWKMHFREERDALPPRPKKGHKLTRAVASNNKTANFRYDLINRQMYDLHA